MDQLRDALKGVGMHQQAHPSSSEARPGVPLAEQGLYENEWVRLLGRFATVQKGRTSTHLEHLLHATVKELKKKGNKRDARDLADLHDAWRKRVDKQTWAAAKARFAELELSEKTWRAVKQNAKDPAKLLERLNTRRAEEYRAAGTKRVQEWLLA